MKRRLEAFAAAAVVVFGLVVALWLSQRETPSVGLSGRWDGARAVAAKLTEAVGGATPSAVPVWLAQPEVGARKVAGRVTLNGAPVANAHVQLMTWGADAQLIAVTSTGRDGTFDLGKQAALAVTVAASAPGALDTQVYVDLRNPVSPLPSDVLELKLTNCQNHLRGHVFDTAGLPLEHAWVHLDQTRGVETNAKGEYDLCLPNYRPIALAEAPGYAGWSKPITGTGNVEYDFRLAPEALIVGRVVEAETGVPVASALVFAKPTFRVSQSDEGPSATRAVTDADGRFSLSVMPGTALLFAQGPAASSSQELMVAASVGHTNAPLTLQIKRLPTLRGLVRNDGRPVAGAGIMVKGTRQWAVAAVSQADGTFVLPRVPLGKLALTAEPYSIVATNIAEMPSTDTSIELEVRPRAKLHGTVTTPAGEPASGVWLTAKGGEQTDDSMNIGGATTDASGHYSMDGLSAGRWSITEGLSRDALVPPEGVVLNEGDDREVNLVLRPKKPQATVSGRVVTEAGTPVVGAHVTLSKRGGVAGFGGQSRAEGVFECEVAEGGTYDVRGYFPGGGTITTVTVPEGGKVEGLSVVVVDNRTRLLGQVVDGEGSPVPDVLVRVQAKMRETVSIISGLPLTTTITDPQGQFSVEATKGQRYLIEATPTDGSSRVLTEAVADDREATVAFATPATIEGDLVGFGTPPQVLAIEPGNHRSSRATVDGTTFTMRVAPGRYQVLASNKADVANTEVEVKSGERVRLKLTTQGVGVLQGTVITAATHEPVRGMVCSSSPAKGLVLDSNSAFSDGRGQFTLDPAPAGEVVVHCHHPGEQFNSVQVATTVPIGGRGNATLEVVPWSWPRRPH
jgi:hypothetical protein